MGRIQLSIMATVVSCREVVVMSGDSRILMRGLRYSEKAVCLYHFHTDACTEFLNLLSDVLQEGIAAPMTNQHDHEERDAHQVHRHSSSTLDGMKAEL